VSAQISSMVSGTQPKRSSSERLPLRPTDQKSGQTIHSSYSAASEAFVVASLLLPLLEWIACATMQPSLPLAREYLLFCRVFRVM
jgi:hypothetical protein